MIASTTDNLFRSEAEILAEQKKEELKIKNKDLGHPIKWTSKILCMCKNFDSSLIFIGESGFLVKLFHIPSKKVVRTLKGHSGPVTCVIPLIFMGQNCLFSGSWDKSIRWWNADTGDCLYIFNGHSDFVKCLQIHDNYLFSSSSDKSIIKWSLHSKHVVKKIRLSGRGIESFVLSDLDNKIYSGGSDGVLRVIEEHELDDFKISEYKYHDTSIYCVKNHEGDIWSSSADNSVKRFNPSSGAFDINLLHPDWVKKFVIVSNYIITGSRDCLIRVFDLKTSELVNTINGHYDEVSSLVVVGNKIYSGSYDCTLRQWNILDEKEESDKLCELDSDEERELNELLDE